MPHVARVVVHSQDQHLYPGQFGPDSHQGVQPADARHAEVQQNQVRLQHSGLLDRLQSVGGLTHHGEVGVAAQHVPEARAQYGMIIGQENAKRCHRRSLPPALSA